MVGDRPHRLLTRGILHHQPADAGQEPRDDKGQPGQTLAVDAEPITGERARADGAEAPSNGADFDGPAGATVVVVVVGCGAAVGAIKLPWVCFVAVAGFAAISPVYRGGTGGGLCSRLMPTSVEERWAFG